MFAAKMGIMGKRKQFRHAFPDWKPCPLLKRRFGELPLLLSMKGLWTGLTICVLMQSVFFLLYLAKLDWKKAADDVCIPVTRQIWPVSFTLWHAPSFKFCSSRALPMSQAMIRAGVKTKEETKMTRMKSAGNFWIPHYIRYLHSVWSSVTWLMILKRVKLLLTQHSHLLQLPGWLTRKRSWGRLRCAGVVNKQGEESVSFVTSQRGCFQQLSVLAHIYRKAKTSTRRTDSRQIHHCLSPKCG